MTGNESFSIGWLRKFDKPIPPATVMAPAQAMIAGTPYLSRVLLSRSVNVASFVLCGCPIVAKTGVATSGAAKIADIAIRFWDCLALSQNQKLLPHFREARTAVFAVEEVEYGGHDRTPSFDRDHQFPRYHVSWDAIRNLDHMLLIAVLAIVWNVLGWR
jgi:hypothetical protein